VGLRDERGRVGKCDGGGRNWGRVKSVATRRERTRSKLQETVTAAEKDTRGRGMHWISRLVELTNLYNRLPR
jgi:hypothetical protein